MLKKIILGSIFILLMNNHLPAQDISTGVKLIRDEKFNSAKKYFYSLLNTDKKAEAYFYLGQIFYLTENLDSAEISYLSGIKADTEQPLNYAGLVKINLLSNEISEADNNIKNALELSNEKSPLVYNTLSEAYSNAKIKDYSKAIELLSNAIKLNPKYIDSYISLSKVNLLKGNGTEAIKNSEDVLNIDSKNPEALTIKAKVYILINKNNEAIVLLNDAIKSDSSYSPAFNELAELYANLKDYSKAAEFYRKYIEASEVTSEKQKRYASILYVNKEYEKAISILEDALTKENNSASTIRIIAYSYLRLSNVEKSKYYFEQLFKIKSAEFLPSDYENYADLLSKTGNEMLALDYLAKVVELDSSRKDILGKMSVIYFKNKNWDGVINSLTEKENLTAQENFDLSKAYIFKGDGNITNALQALTSKVKLEVEQIDKTRQILLYYQGDLSQANGNNQKIIEARTKTIQSIESLLNPNQKKDWNIAKEEWCNLIELTISNEYAKADSCLNILISKAPNLTIAYVWQARVKANFDPESENGLAKPFYEKFIELAKIDQEKFKKELIESYSYLGYYYYLQKDNQKSKAVWQEVLLIEPDNKQATEVIKQLK
jgi:tetratricopeptide (TPR) repeat protein